MPYSQKLGTSHVACRQTDSSNTPGIGREMDTDVSFGEGKGEGEGHFKRHLPPAACPPSSGLEDGENRDYTTFSRIAPLTYDFTPYPFQMAQRLTLRKRTPYNTKSNRRRVIKTPGGKLRYLHINKLPTAPKCGDCHVALPGVKALRPREYATVSKTSKTVQRAYGGSRCANCVRTR